MVAGRSDPGHHHPLADLPLGAAPARFRRIAVDGGAATADRAVLEEMPVAVELDGVGYAVMMATPDALEDFAAGFLLAERLIDGAADIVEVEAVHAHRGVLLRITLSARARGRAAGRARIRVADSACGLCGLESLEHVLRPLPRVPIAAIEPAAVFVALSTLDSAQSLGRATRAAHAAAACAADGVLRLVREDVGRHNAFDKLVGAMARKRIGWDGGFALVTSRLSYEIVEKAALSGCPAIAAISLPTDLALARAAEAGIRVFALARPDALLEALPPG